MSRLDADGYVLLGDDSKEHRVVAEAALGHPLPPGAEIHHVNGDRADNRPENLVICPSHAYHMLLHARQVILDSGGCPDKDAYCSRCETVHPKSEFYGDRSKWNGVRHMCKDQDKARRRKEVIL